MVYAKGGGAWVGSSNPTIAVDGVAGTRSPTSTSNWGWTVGAGAEYAFYGGWSARIEYDYVGLTNQTFTVPAAAAVTCRRSIHLQQPQHPDGHRWHQL